MVLLLVGTALIMLSGIACTGGQAGPIPDIDVTVEAITTQDLAPTPTTTPVPTDTPLLKPTHTPELTYTPISTDPPAPTPTPTSIPTSTPTPTPTHTPTPTATPIALRERTFNDRPDDTPDYQIHLIYAVPSDGHDAKLDINGTIAREIAAAQAWFEEQTEGLKLRFDTYEGELDVTFIRLSETDEVISSYGTFALSRIEKSLLSSGFDPNKIYGVYYDGTTTRGCPRGSWPPHFLGNVVVMYLQGSSPACQSYTFATSKDTPGKWGLSLIHETLHTLGIVAECAPNHSGEVTFLTILVI